MLTPFVAQSLGELAEGALGGCIRRDGDATLERKDGAKVDDFASSEGDHMTPGCLAQEPGSFEIDIEDLRVAQSGIIRSGRGGDRDRSKKKTNKNGKIKGWSLRRPSRSRRTRCSVISAVCQHS